MNFRRICNFAVPSTSHQVEITASAEPIIASVLVFFNLHIVVANLHHQLILIHVFLDCKNPKSSIQK